MNNILNEKHSIYTLDPNITKGLIMCVGILDTKIEGMSVEHCVRPRQY